LVRVYEFILIKNLPITEHISTKRTALNISPAKEQWLPASILRFISKKKHCTHRYVVVLGILHQSLVAGLFQVIDGEVVRRRQIGAERSVSAGDQDGAGTRGHVPFHLVVDIQASGLSLLLQDLGVSILADAAEEYSHPGLSQDPLGDPQRVLHGSTSQELRIVAFDQLPVNGHVSVLGQDRIVLVHRVPLQEVHRDDGGDVQQRVAAAHQDSFSAGKKIIGIISIISLISVGLYVEAPNLTLLLIRSHMLLV